MPDRIPLKQKHVPGLNLKFKLLLGITFSTPYELEKKKNEHNNKVNELNRFFKHRDGEKKLEKFDISKFIKTEFFKLCDAQNEPNNLEDFLKEKPALRKKLKKLFKDELIDQTGMDETEFTEWKKEVLDKVSKHLDDNMGKLKKEEGDNKNELEEFKKQKQ